MKNIETQKYINLKNKYKKIVDIIASIRMLTFILMIICFFAGSSLNILVFIAVILLIAFIILIIIHDKYYKKLDYYEKYLNILNQYKARKNGQWKKFPNKGEEYTNDLFNDLNIVGNNSLFQYLNISQTKGGSDKLIEMLSNKQISTTKIKERQETIKELTQKINFDIDFQVQLLEFETNKIDLKDNFPILDKNIGNRNIDLTIAIIFNIIVWILLILGLTGILTIKLFSLMFILNFLSNYMYSQIYREEFENITSITSIYSKLSKIYTIILNNNFQSQGLKKITQSINKGENKVKKLVKIDNLNTLKNNILSSFIFNGLFSVNIIVMYLYSKFHHNDTTDLKEGAKAVEQLEALISLAGLAIIREDVSMPIIEDKITLEFTNLKHPLLEPKSCIGNDFKGKNGTNIITGSNMGGKTSFIRTIGINMILMNAGTYVCAKNFTGSYMKIFTSISIKDNIDKGISTFYEELIRVKNALDYKEGNRLVLIDEIFKGTNYQDRIYGAINVIKKLNDKKTILFVTTHDFELCDIKTNNISNYYVKEYYEGNIIKFDYKIRKGKCQSTNAKYLMKTLSIID